MYWSNDYVDVTKRHWDGHEVKLTCSTRLALGQDRDDWFSTKSTWIETKTYLFKPKFDFFDQFWALSHACDNSFFSDAKYKYVFLS